MTATIEASETMTAREIAKAIGVAPRTRNYEMRDRDGYTILGTLSSPRYAKVLCSLSRSDISDVSFRVRIVAMALYKSISTGRMHPVASTRIQAYTPYQICTLVARIARECPETTIGGICDVWIAENHASL